MAQINLLPWREEARKIKLTQFLIKIGISATIAIVMVLMVNIYMRNLIRVENRRADFLQAAVAQKQQEYTALREEKQNQEAIEAQLKFISEMRQKSLRIVLMLNELNSSVTASVTINKLRKLGNKITLEGKANTAVEITKFMKKLSKSPYFKQPELTKINAEQSKTDSGRLFQIEIEQKNEKIS